MTIGPLPPHPGLIRALSGGPAEASIPAPDGDAFGDMLRSVAVDASDRRIGGTLLRETVERFNEHGFFADHATLAASDPGGTAVSVSLQIAMTALPNGASGAAADLVVDGGAPTGMAATGPLANAGPAAETDADTVFDRAGATLAAGTSEVPGIDTIAGLPSSPPVAAKGAAIAAPTVAITRALATDESGPAPARIRPTLDQAARSPISVTIDAGEAAAAVTVAAHGLTDSQAEALRVDIAALLRRHGLVLDDVRINGRPTGQGRNTSGG